MGQNSTGEKHTGRKPIGGKPTGRRSIGGKPTAHFFSSVLKIESLVIFCSTGGDKRKN